MNQQKSTTYQLVFGQPPHSSQFPGATAGSVMEEAVSDILCTCNMFLYMILILLGTSRLCMI